MSADLTSAFTLIEADNLTQSLPQWKATVVALVHKYGRISAYLAGQFYRQQRLSAGLGARFALPPVEPAPIERISASLDWATRGLWTPEPDTATVQAVSDGVVQKLVTGMGRGQILQAVHVDIKARGWVREARPDCCSFCRLLSIRGPVYRSEQTASFEAHDHDHCIPVPVFRDQHYVAPEHVLAWREQYRAATAGLSGAKARNAFRQSVEGRTPPK